MTLKAFSRGNWYCDLFTAVLVASLIFPSFGYGADEGDTEGESSSALARVSETQPIVNAFRAAHLTSYAHAADFAKGIIAAAKLQVELLGLPDGTVLRAQLLHFEGQKVNPYLDWVLKYLNHASINIGKKTVNIEARGDFVTAAQFNKFAEDFERNLPTEDQLSAFQLTYGKATGEEADPYHASLWANIKATMGWVSDKLFGAPYGATLLACFLVRETVPGIDENTPATSRYRWRFLPDPKVKETANTVTLIGLSWIVGMKTLGAWITRADAGWFFPRFTDLGALAKISANQFYPDNHINWSFLAILAVVGVIVYTCLRNSREVDLVRRGGGRLLIDSDAEPGSQITVVANDRGYVATCTGQECFLNNSILLVDYLFGVVRFDTWAALIWAVLFKTINGGLAAFSYTAMEEVRGGLLQQANRLQEVAPVRSAQLEDSAARLGKFFWGVPFPVANNTAQFLTGWWTQLPLIVLGTAGFIARRIGRMYYGNPNRDTAASVTKSQPDSTNENARCSDLLIIRAIRPKSE